MLWCVSELDRFGAPLGGPPVPYDLESLKAVVAQQRGLVTTVQCHHAGITDSAIRHRLRTGRWVAVRRGVYLTRSGADRLVVGLDVRPAQRRVRFGMGF